MQSVKWLHPRQLLKIFAASSIALFLLGFSNSFSIAEYRDREVETHLPVTPQFVPLFYSLEKYAQNTVSGGPGKDGIPAIDTPRFVSAGRAESFLGPEDIVFGVVLNDEVKAYPQKILVWHEIVNDRLGHENVSVTYCPLTGTAIGFKRGETTFGVSGRLVNNNLIMYDRATDSRWPQILGTAVSGSFKGKSLEEFRVIWTAWGRWKQRYPETEVLSENTGYIRNYQRDPYGSYHPLGGYYAEGSPPLFPVLHRDRRFDPKAVVLGARTRDGVVAFKKNSLRAKKIMEGTLSGKQYIAFYDPVLDTGYIYKNPERKLFVYENGQYTNADGKWEAGDLPLEKVNAFDAMWFAWAAFYPETDAYE
ncbi:conserved hypothetical protein [Nitrosococcus halophilus Nc 4]|uniref:DUF3179 domain-containing protein n=1 Tax=Nitrosococcus halophilus (strain Nc4) TaxID=472759 RepID=D5BYM1_NITHN|nr:DUF3179 domain-containing protein [Nitrosococcus halophilus]ADE16009.1 conserved hypothetical protein [Nitrosococcus halophilus Nc 4]